MCTENWKLLSIKEEWTNKIRYSYIMKEDAKIKVVELQLNILVCWLLTTGSLKEKAQNLLLLLIVIS